MPVFDKYAYMNDRDIVVDHCSNYYKLDLIRIVKEKLD